MTRTVNRFFFTLILQELWQQKPVHQVAEMFHVNRGVVQNLAVAAASYSSSVIRYCEELEEFWACKVLLAVMVKQLSYCCNVELLPLMDLPCVKIVSRLEDFSMFTSNNWNCFAGESSTVIFKWIQNFGGCCEVECR